MIRLGTLARQHRNFCEDDHIHFQAFFSAHPGGGNQFPFAATSLNAKVCALHENEEVYHEVV
jgi:hypothetical protein